MAKHFSMVRFLQCSRHDAVDLVPADRDGDLHELSEMGYCIANAPAD